MPPPLRNPPLPRPPLPNPRQQALPPPLPHTLPPPLPHPHTRPPHRQQRPMSRGLGFIIAHDAAGHDSLARAGGGAIVVAS